MIDLGKGVSVDFREHPYVFGIEGWDPIRIQKSNTRINGVSLKQLELIVKTLKGVKREDTTNTGDAVETTAGEDRPTRGRGAKSSKGTRYST